MEVKTKSTTRAKPPELHYNGSIAHKRHPQAPDYWCFCRVFYTETGQYPNVVRNYQYGWVIGLLYAYDLEHVGEFLAKGQREGDNGFVSQSNQWLIKYRSLEPCWFLK